VLTPVLDGGRDPGQRTRYVAWGDDPSPERAPERPWPGRLPAPAPSVLIDPPRPISVLDAHGRTVIITERGALPMPPARFALLGEPPVEIAAWAGPWPVDERWWAETPTGLRARFQLVDVGGQAYLVACTVREGNAAWTLEARYD
jgi:protein ImuB